MTVPRLREPAERVSPRARLLWTVEAVLNSVLTLGVYVGVGLGFDPVPFS